MEKSQKSGTVNFFLHLRVHLRLQVPASSLRLDDLVATVMILRRTVEVTGISTRFSEPAAPARQWRLLGDSCPFCQKWWVVRLNMAAAVNCL